MLEVLRRFSRREISPVQVMRELVAHDGWFVPGAWAPQAVGTDRFEHACVWGQQPHVPPGHLWLFTSREAGLRAVERGAIPGLYVGPVPGAPVFAGIPPSVTTLTVNPGSPQEEGWFMEGAKAMALARTWGRAIGLERSLAVAGADLLERLSRFDAYLGLVTPSGGIATAVGLGGMKNPGMIFTAVDCVEEARRVVGPSAQSLKSMQLTGEALFSNIETLGIDGLIVNPAGPGVSMPLTMEACRLIAASIADAKELERLEAIANQES